ncbi:hypothetical protein ABZ128_19655 [Streptomyces sp. NPDC006326]|uniref:hypothetical protein n=1 Tax=Streptomyces sp. NPDC006326 TaxID=3156752 RepID=UPI00339E5930
MDWPDQGRPDHDFLVALPDLSGVVLATGAGYALIAGDGEFLRHGVPEGVGQAVVNFRRYTQRISVDVPAGMRIWDDSPTSHRAFVRPDAIPADSAVGEQIALMRALSASAIRPAPFAAAWLSARRKSSRRGERLGEPLSRILDQVLYTVDDHPIDPGLREPGDATDAELTAAVVEALAAIDRLAGP